MRKTLAVLMVLIVLASGCLGGSNTATSQSSASPASSATTVQPTTHSSAPTTSTTEKPKPSFSPLESLKEIKRFTYTENASVNMTIEMSFANGTQSSNLRILINESGYIDFEKRVAGVNTTTTTLPDNVSVTITTVVLNGTEYVKTPAGTARMNDSLRVWETNPVSVALAVLSSERPVANYTEKGRLVLVYSVQPGVIIPMAELYFTGPKTNITITDATMSLYFENGTFVGAKLAYSVIAVSSMEDPLLGKMTIEQRGEWKGDIRITSINREFEVRPPT